MSWGWSKGGFGNGRESGRGPSVPYIGDQFASAQGHKDLEAVIELVRKLARDLFTAVPNSPASTPFFRCCLIIADHNSYPIGELAIGGQVAELWPKGRKA